VLSRNQIAHSCMTLVLQGETKCFSKKGFKLPGYFLSVLPGGNGTEYGYGPTGMQFNIT